MRTNEKFRIDREMLDTEHLEIKILVQKIQHCFFLMSCFFEKRLDKQMKIDDCTITYVLFYMKTKFARCCRIKVRNVH